MMGRYQITLREFAVFVIFGALLFPLYNVARAFGMQAVVVSVPFLLFPWLSVAYGFLEGGRRYMHSYLWQSFEFAIAFVAFVVVLSGDPT